MTATEIRALRDEMRCTQRKFAALMRVTPRTVQAWESGVKPQAHSLLILRQAAVLFDTSHRMKGQK